jgi:DNA-binding PadR family transcriptional regulator
MDDVRRTPVVTHDEKLRYAGIYVLKKMDLKPEEGGLEMPIVLPPELSPLEDVLQELVNADLLEVDRRKARFQLTRKGLSYLAEIIDEAEALVEEFDEMSLEEAVAELRRRNLDVLRARFLWGWYDGELDDLVLFQQRRGVTPVESWWADYLMSDAFYEALTSDYPRA